MNKKLMTACLALCAWSVLAVAQTGSNAAGEMVLPSGTQIAVRTNEAIDSTTASQSTRYTAEVVNDVKGSGGEVLIPKGSDRKSVV